MRDVTNDFVENILSNGESNDVEDANTFQVNNYDTHDPDIQIIADKFKTGCKCKQGNCLGSFHQDDVYQLWLIV